MKELLLEKLRSAIATKEWVTACANHDVAKFGEWQCDYWKEMGSAQDDVDQCIKNLIPWIERGVIHNNSLQPTPNPPRVEIEPAYYNMDKNGLNGTGGVHVNVPKCLEVLR